MPTKHHYLALALIFALGFFNFSSIASAEECPELNAGDLIKVPEHSAVYVINKNMKRMYFPNDEVYSTWYDGYWNVKTIPAVCVDNYPTGGGINYRPGSRLIKTASSPIVYAISNGNIKQPIKNAEIAEALYGKQWNTLVRIIPDVFVANYRQGNSIFEARPHDGQLIQKEGDADMYYLRAGKMHKINNALPNNMHSDVRIVIDTMWNRIPRVAITENAETIAFNPSQDIVYKKVIVQTEPLELGRDQVLELTDTHLIIKNNIRLRDNARLIIKNSHIDHRKDYSFQYGLNVYDDAQVIIENSRVSNECNGAYNWSFYNRSSLTASSVDMSACNVWNYFTDNAKADITHWDRFGATTCEFGNTKIAHSKKLELELCHPAGAVVDEELPMTIDHFVYPNANEKNINTRWEINTSTMRGWGIGVSPTSDITIRNTPAVTVSVVVGWPWKNQNVVLENLGKKTYADTTWKIADARLHFQNVSTYGWEPNVWENNRLTIKNSEYSGSSVNGGDGVYIIDNVTTWGPMRTHEKVQMTIRNSTIGGDVIAADDSIITLINTTVRGKIFQERRGRVIGRSL